MRSHHQVIHHSFITSLLVAATILLGGCGGGGGGSGTPSAPATSSGASSAASSSTASSVASSSISSSAASNTSAVSLYVTEPVIANCDSGLLKDSERTAVLDKVNAIRSRHGLLPLTYDASEDSAAAETAMYMVANQTLTISPNSSGLCYTAAAAQFAPQSNLYAFVTPGNTTQNVPGTASVVSYLMSLGVDSLAFRRKLLNPFLGKTTYGRVDGQPNGTTNQVMASVLKVQGNDASDVSAMSNDFVAYPYGIYPTSEFSPNWYLSFSVIASKTDASHNGSAYVNFAGAVISILDGLTPIAVTDQSGDYADNGLPNSLKWKAPGLQPNVTYAVRIDNVIVNGVSRQYNYSFSIQ